MKHVSEYQQIIIERIHSIACIISVLEDEINENSNDLPDSVLEIIKKSIIVKYKKEKKELIDIIARLNGF